jgi:hypothetical protein
MFIQICRIVIAKAKLEAIQASRALHAMPLPLTQPAGGGVGVLRATPCE